MLGKGASAVVYKGSWKGRDVAIKVFDPMGLYFNLEEIRRELALGSMIEHPNIVTFYGGSLGPSKTFIVMEFMDKVRNHVT